MTRTRIGHAAPSELSQTEQLRVPIVTVKSILAGLLVLALAMTALVAVPAATVAAQANADDDRTLLRAWTPNSSGVPTPNGEVRSSQDGTDYGSAPRLMDFDDSSWPVTLMLPDADAGSQRKGFYASRNNVVADGRGYYFRYEFEIEDVYQITAMDLDVYYDDAVVLFLNGQEIYRTIRNNIPGAAATNPSIYQFPTYGGLEEYYVPIPGTPRCESPPPDPCDPSPLSAIDPGNLVDNPVADSPNELIEGTNVLMAMVWTRVGSDIGFDVGMTVDRDENAPFPAPLVDPLANQANELADAVSVAVSAVSENDPNSLNFIATGLPDGLAINASTGVISGTPTAIGQFNATVTVTDSVGTTSISFDWVVTNAAPVIVDPGPQQTPVDNAVSLPLTITDPDGGAVSVSISGLPTGLIANGSTISGTPTVEGANTVTITATDDENETTTITVPWQIAEPPIDLVSPGSQSTAWGQPVTLALEATDPAGGDVSLTVAPLPEGLTFDPATNTISGTPTQIGSTNVVVEGTGQSGSAVLVFTWDITNVTAAVTVPADQVTLAQFSQSNLVATASDPDGGPVALAAGGLPPGISFDRATGVFSGSADVGGTFTVEVTATDDENETSTGSFEWQVFAPVDHPIQINEVVASNEGGLLDEDQDDEDWFEIQNTSGLAIDITGWSITDDSSAWTVPQIVLEPGEYLTLFASGKDRSDPAANLHTNFKISKEGDALSIITPNEIVIDRVDPLPLAFKNVAMGVRADGTFGYLDEPTPGSVNSAAGSDYAPVLRPFSDRLYNVGETVFEQIDGFDPDGAPLTYDASLPPGMTIDTATGVISGEAVAAGTFPTTIQIEDVDSRQEDQPVNWFIIPEPTLPAGLVLNEYNAVTSSGVFVGDADPAFTEPVGNGGDWFEFVVVEDGLDLRGWTLEFWDRDNGDDSLRPSAELVFVDDPFLASLPSGLIITVAEDVPDDVLFNPAAGDWHVNFQSSDDEIDDPNGGDPVKVVAGSYFTFESQENFNSSRSNQNVLVRDASGAYRMPAVGETEAWDAASGGVGRGEVMSLCIDPTTEHVDPLADYFDNILDSSFGEPNRCLLRNDPLTLDDDVIVDQSLDGLRTAATLQSVAVSAYCKDGNGVIQVDLSNQAGAVVDLQVTVTGLPTRTVSVAADGTTTTWFSGRPDGMYSVEVRSGGEVLATNDQQVFCDGESGVVTSCLAGNGLVSVRLANPTAATVTYTTSIGSLERSSEIAPWASGFIRVSGRPDGDYEIEISRDGVVIGVESTTVDCDPTIPAPDGVFPAVTCLGGNGRLDVNVVNGDQPATYRLEVEGLGARVRTVAANDWWRSPIAGRPDGELSVRLFRDATLIMDDEFTVSCDTAPPVVDAPEIQLLNACRNGRGFVAWQIANPTGGNRTWDVSFEGAPAVSRTALAHQAATVAVSARPDGDYFARINVAGVDIWSETVTVDCAP